MQINISKTAIGKNLICLIFVEGLWAICPPNPYNTYSAELKGYIHKFSFKKMNKCFAGGFCQFDTNLDIFLKERFLIEKIPPKDWPVSKSVGHFPDLMTDV